MYQLPTTTLGRTGLRVTRLGIGGGYCETADGYRAALDCGATYLDTARSYRNGEDERVIGEALDGRRDGVVLATKTGKRSAADARAELETSLRMLHTDHVDIWQLHFLNAPEALAQVLAPGGAAEAAVRAREEGLTRFIGVTGHDWSLVARAAATGLFDTLLCWYNCAMKEPEETLFPTAVAQRMGVVIMQAARNTRLLSESGTPAPEQFFRYVLSHPAVNVTLMGLRSEDRFRRVAGALAERATLAPEERRELEAYGSALRAAGKLG
ncbi:MAG: aldo/keto reductase [Armatimonadetes bacterium]|nr:aldo/keto reductase [Armatimonadota bacterium]